ncbi:MAG: HD domain-containing protein [Chloroflexi bacterium]|nr:MAG: HD domain-containing protein [Chloroflexota bacterium]
MRKDVSWIWELPSAGNARLQALLDHIGQDRKLHQLWRVANVNAVARTGITDHGPEHIGIVTGNALHLLRLLVQAGILPNIVKDYGMSVQDAEVIVALAACLHDIGISVHRDNHEQYSLLLAEPEGRRLLAGIYEEPDLTTVISEMLHAIIAHRWDVHCLTLEAGVVKVADALDITKGRSRIPFEAGSTNIHSVSAAAIDDVQIGPGGDVPICIEIRMSNSAGIFQIDELLKRKLRNSTLAPYVQVLARIEGETEKRLVPFYSME